MDTDDDMIAFEGSSTRFGRFLAMRAGYLATAAGAALMGGGVALAFTLPAGTAAVSGPPAGSPGTMHIQILSTLADSGAPVPVMIYGPFAAYGTAELASVNGTTKATLMVGGGTIYVNGTDSGGGTEKLDPATCVFRTQGLGTYTIVGGTGKYRGITGHGTFTASVLGIGHAKSAHRCANPVAAQQVITASGPVKLP